MSRTSTARIGLGVTAMALAVAGTIATAPSASAAKPDTTCQRAGHRTLQGAGLLDDVARGGLPISLAVGLGVAPRAGTDVSALPDPLPLSVVLADHRAGDNSLFVYPWCAELISTPTIPPGTGQGPTRSPADLSGSAPRPRTTTIRACSRWCSPDSSPAGPSPSRSAPSVRCSSPSPPVPPSARARPRPWAWPRSTAGTPPLAVVGGAAIAARVGPYADWLQVASALVLLGIAVLTVWMARRSDGRSGAAPASARELRAVAGVRRPSSP